MTGKSKNGLRIICSLIIFGLCSVGARVFAADSLRTLSGHVPAVVSHLAARGTLPPTNRLNLAIGLPLRNSSELDRYLTQLYDPSSTNYHRYLTPEQFTKKYGPTEADYAAVVWFARQNHFNVTATYGNRLLLDVNGSVADIQRAFHTTLRSYRHPAQNRDFYAADLEPSVDANLPIADISGLDNFILPHPRSHISLLVQQGAKPESGSGPGGTYMGNDFRAAYLPGVFWNGSGQTVGMVEFDGFYPSDISSYQTNAGLPAIPVQTVLLDGYNGVPTIGFGSGNPEVSLDIELAMSMAPGLSGVVVFEAGPFGLQNDVLNALAASNQISQISCSWGWGGGPTNTTDDIFKQMAAQGQSFFQASGDSDAFTTGSNSINGVDNPSIDNSPSSSPYITAVGGTTLTTSGPGGSWSSESVWNWGFDSAVGNYVGSSGGISSFYSIPDWQANVNMASNGGSPTNRNIPDVALTGDNIEVDYGDGTSGTFGGTSCAAPLWAAVAAMMNEQSLAAGRTTVGFINPAVYALGNSTNYNECFHDITNGNNFSSDSPDEFSAVTGYDLCTGWGTPAGQSLIDAIAGQPDSLEIFPAAGFSATEAGGGLFRAASTTFQLTNSGAAPLDWSLINTSAWLQVSATNGILPVGGITNVTVNLAPFANNLEDGAYTADLQFTNGNTQLAQNFPFTLQVMPSLVQNGGFETGDFTDWTLVGQTVVATSFGETIYNAVEGAAFYPLAVHSGDYGAFLGDTQVATLSQTLATIPGDNYLISFWMDNTVSGTTQIFQVNWDGASLYSVTNPPSFSWTNFEFIATAAGNDTIQFGAENEPNFWGLDDVSVTHVPSPAFKSIGHTAATFDLGWNTATGLVYQVQYKTNLLQADWSNLTQPITAISDSLAVTDSIASQRFYRLVISP
ncbi:MAG TPA: protease pro-enzyme activation domain-containing protein [Verrucomicrobiae bacterium]|jgi:subtilase family serine protease|nr:protease pro-enzyme activation domain-containing protein [Verrucomicrobiae bacterium]